jgi:DNA-binding NarL/FixJ family response regulator
MEHGTEEERNIAGAFLGMSLAMVARRTLDEDVRVRWFRGPMGRELAALVGPQVGPAASTPDEQVLTAGLDQPDALLLRLLMEGRTNREIADQLGLAPEVLRRRLAQMYAKVGASSRGEATAIALAEGAL